jgi:hypothetical protein
MAEQQWQGSPTVVPSEGAPPIKVGVMPLFPTWIYLCEEGPNHLNEELE